MERDVVPMRGRSEKSSTGSEGGPERASLVTVHYPLDTTAPVPVRTRQEILKEAILLFPNVVKLLFRLSWDARVPLKARVAIGIVAAYLASPIDLVPDVIPVLGSVDELLVVAFAVDYLLRATSDDVVEGHWDGSEDGLELIRGLAGWGVELLPGRLRRFTGL